MPNLVLKTIMMIKKFYGLEICVFMAPSRGATSGLLFSVFFTLFKPVSSISARWFALRNHPKMILMIIKVYALEICVFMPR